MQAEPEVQVCLHLSGEYDYILQVSLRDAGEYEEFLEKKLCILPMVDKVHSSLVLKEYKMEPALVLRMP
jgi:Lrp/AsnC family leucine-responsive transcriptional regulator